MNAKERQFVEAIGGCGFYLAIIAIAAGYGFAASVAFVGIVFFVMATICIIIEDVK